MTKEKVLFIDAFSTIHVGNGALLDNSIKACKVKFNNPTFTIITSDTKTNKGRYENVVEDVFSNYPGTNLKKLLWTGVFFLNCSIAWFFYKLKVNSKFIPISSRYKKVFKAIIESDKIISISGETLNDHFMPQMYQRCYLFKICINLKKDLYIFPQSIGPIFRKSSFVILRTALSGAKEIYGRDKESFSLAKKIWGGCSVNVSYSPDVAVLQDSIINETAPIFQSNKKVIGLTLSDFPNEIQKGVGDIDLIIQSCVKSFNSNDYAFYLMPSNYKYNEKSNDYVICEYAHEYLTGLGYECLILSDEPIFPEEYQAIQKGLFIFISTRMHVGILATVGSTPTIMINTQHKIRGYMENINMGKQVVEVGSINDNLSTVIGETIIDNAAIKEQLKEENIKMRLELHKALA